MKTFPARVASQEFERTLVAPDFPSLLPYRENKAAPAQMKPLHDRRSVRARDWSNPAMHSTPSPSSADSLALQSKQLDPKHNHPHQQQRPAETVAIAYA